ncbi:MAG: cation-translocating P-type ATPase, partial [Burkholderiales bacterium]|nr:cation-translocating P-type ATPase [Burkholderiales bacterium]
MLKKINDFLAGTMMTCVAGVFLLISLALSFTDIKVPVDPAWVAVIISGLPLLYLSVWRIIYNKGISKISSALLITIAMFAAIAIGDLFAAGEVAFIMAIGAILEDKTTERARKGIKQLISLAPQKGRKVTATGLEMIRAEEIKVDDVLRILPGETVPVDGVIVTGHTSLDQSIMTGESLPVDKEKGDEVFCGTLNRFGSIDIKATKVGEDSSLQKLIHMVNEAETKRAPIQRIADKWASWLVPVALLIAVFTYFATGDITRAVTVLVVFCPCALVLATPTAIMAAVGQATKHGVIIKSGEALEKMSKVDTIAFDKTGTLTYGKLAVSNVVSFSDDISDKDVLSLTASAESRSEHPLGKAIVEHAINRRVQTQEANGFSMEAGKGISAVVAGAQVLCGTERYLKEKSIELSSEAKEALNRFRKEGKASVLTAIKGKCIGLTALSDILKDAAKSVISSLTSMKVKTVLLTGDNHQAANYFAGRLGISEVMADLLPGDKVKCVETLKHENGKVCMIGDVVNDAPALKSADVSAAIVKIGSDIAVDAADIVLM